MGTYITHYSRWHHDAKKKMKVRSLLFFLLLISCALQAQVPQVPRQLYFAGMSLTFTAAAQKKIQADVDRIYQSPTHLNLKIDLANLYFPVVSKAFNEIGVPEEFKFLAIQESALVPDAVSSSNAVGFWQFKKETAIENGLRVNEVVDERMHIFESSKAAARYLRKNNGALRNWIYSLLSYNLGLTGVRAQVKDEWIGATAMTIDTDMHWYVLRFLAHKIAYESRVGKQLHPQLHLVLYQPIRSRSFQSLAEETGIEESILSTYNVWARRHFVPSDKDYVVVLACPVDRRDYFLARYEAVKSTEPVVQHHKPKSAVHDSLPQLDEQPLIHPQALNQVPKLARVNRVKAILAELGDTPHTLAAKGGIEIEGFLRFNEMQRFDSLNAGKYYYLQLKRRQALVAFHTVASDENLWDIAQQYGMRSGAILKKNRMHKREALKPGRVLWLRATIPKDFKIEYRTPMPKPKPVQMERADRLPIGEPIRLFMPDTARIYPHHTVQTGESLFGIAKQYATSTDSIVYWNNLNGYTIKTGMTLIVGPPALVAPVETTNLPAQTRTLHIVKAGETMYSLSKKYGVSQADIMKWNAKSSPELKIGEEVVIFLP